MLTRTCRYLALAFFLLCLVSLISRSAGSIIQVYVAYAENERSPVFFPNPWQASPNTTFLGYPGPAYDTGAILIVNTGTTDVVLGPDAAVDGFTDGSVFRLWDGLIGPSGLTIHPGQQVILAQTKADNSPASCSRPARPCLSNFDSSDTPLTSTPSASTPVVHLTLDGVARTFTDTAQVLNTGGFDIGNATGLNESVQWRLLGTTGPYFPGGSGVNPPAVSTWHNDASRTGLNSSETTLTPSNVNPATFGRLFAYPVDGQIYAQPLFVPNVVINSGTHNTVFVATENNSVYAFDAESPAPNGQFLWHTSLGPPVQSWCANVRPTFGVTGTPVVDTATNTLYVVSKNTVSVSPPVYAARLHALDLGSGAEKFGGPVEIAGSVPGTGEGSIGGLLAFDPGQQFQRSALLLYNGSVYIAFGSHCDIVPYHGWLFGYNATNISQQTAIFSTTPNATSTPPTAGCPGYGGEVQAGGSIWMAGAGPAADASGIFATTANGTFDVNTGGIDYGNTILKLVPGATTRLSVGDFFTPSDQGYLRCNDKDLGASGPLLVPGSNPPLLVHTSKARRIYLVSRATGSMGQYNASCTTPGPPCDHIVQAIDDAIANMAWGAQGCAAAPAPPKDSEIHSSPAYFNNTVYFQGECDSMRAFQFVNGLFSTPPIVNLVTSPSTSFATPSISYDSNATNPAATGIVWFIEKKQSNDGRLNGQAVLHAYAANDLHELYDSSKQGQRDFAGNAMSFTVPTIAAGKVFVGTDSQLVVYGSGFSFPAPTGTLTLKKIVVPGNDPGRFDLLIDGTVQFRGAGNNAVVGPIQLPPGAHTVTDSSSAGTTGSYSIWFQGDCASNGIVTVEPGDNKACVLGNSHGGGAFLTVRKVLAPVNDPARFDIFVDGALLMPSAGNGSTTAKIPLSPGTHLVSEVEVPPPVPDCSGKYSTQFQGACAPSGSVILAPGDNKICTVLNAKLKPICPPGLVWCSGPDGQCGCRKPTFCQ